MINHNFKLYLQLGIFEVPDDDGNDSDLEAELLAITSGNNSPKKTIAKPKLINDNDLNKMVEQSLKDTYSEDEDMSEGEDDPDLLNELQEITGDEPIEEAMVEEPSIPPVTDSTEIVKTLEQRIEMYEIAEKKASNAGEVARSRRFSRGLKTLRDLLKQAKSGKSINIDDIPPEVSTKLVEPSKDEQSIVARPAPPVPKMLHLEEPSEIKEEIIFSPTSSDIPAPVTPIQQEKTTVRVLKERLLEYKQAALKAKKEGDKESALQFIKIVKQFDVVIKMAENGEKVDLSDMPPPPDQLKVSFHITI